MSITGASICKQLLTIFTFAITLLAFPTQACLISAAKTSASQLNQAVQNCVADNNKDIRITGKFTNNSSSTINVYLSSGVTLRGYRIRNIETTADPSLPIQPPPMDGPNYVRDRDFEYHTVLENIQIQMGGVGISVRDIAFANYTIPSPVITFGIGLGHTPTQTISSFVSGNLFKNVFNNAISQPIISIRPDMNHHSNTISWNTFYNWGNADQTVQAIKIGEERLNHFLDGGTSDLTVSFRDWQGIAWKPAPGKVDWPKVTRVHGNVFVGFYKNESNDLEVNAMVPKKSDGSSNNQSDVVQTYNPAIITQNCMRNSVNGISVKGHRVVVKNNWLQGINGDGALYHRDGNFTKFTDNLVENNTVGIWTWSGEHLLFNNNVVRDNDQLAKLNGAEHGCSRLINNRPEIDPISEVPGSSCNLSAAMWDDVLRGQTSYQFTTDNVLFVKNTFVRNDLGMSYNHNGRNSANNFGRPEDLWFIQNRYSAGDTPFTNLTKSLGDSNTVNHRNNTNFVVHSTWAPFSNSVTGNPPSSLGWNSALFQRPGSGADWSTVGILNNALDERCTRYMK